MLSSGSFGTENAVAEVETDLSDTLIIITSLLKIVSSFSLESPEGS